MVDPQMPYEVSMRSTGDQVEFTDSSVKHFSLRFKWQRKGYLKTYEYVDW